MSAAAAAVAGLTTLLNWFSGFSFWQTSSGADIVLLILLLATIASGVGAFITRLPLAGMANTGIALVAAGFLIGWSVEAMLGGDPGVGAFLGFLTALAVAAAGALPALLATPEAEALVRNFTPGGEQQVSSKPFPPGPGQPFPPGPGRSAAPGAAHRPTENPAAGWYADPAESARERFWDGQQWTSQVR